MSALVFVVSALGCQSRESFEEKISKSRGTLVDQVAVAGDGLPYFTAETLNPVWKEGEAKIVRIPRLELTDQAGRKRGQEMFEGKVSFVGFFFASCRGFCPILVQSLRRIEKELGPVRDVQYVALTVDPEHDTPRVLSEYAATKGLDTSSHWTLLTGPVEVIHGLAKDTFVSQAFRRPTPPSERNFVHSEHIYVIDQRGRLRAVLNGTRVDLPGEARKVAAQLLPKMVLAGQ